MSNGGDLLRLLMPAVSPVPGVPGTPTRDAPGPGAQPIESRSFESLLEEANRIEVQQPIDGAAKSDKSPEPDSQPSAHRALAGLSGIESIQNASLRQIVADAAGR